MLAMGWEQQLRYSFYLSLEVAGLETKTYPEDSLPLNAAWLESRWSSHTAQGLPWSCVPEKMCSIGSVVWFR